MKCLCLIRVSTGHQDLEQQTIKVKNEALKDGYNEDNIIVLEDIESGVKLSEEERNGLNKLKQLISNDPEINCVYTYEISRISRQPKTLYNIRDFLIDHHVQLVVMNPYFKMLGDDGNMNETSNIFFGIFSSLAEQEGYLRKARIKKAVDKYKAEGRFCGGNYMFGYTVDANHRYIIHPENAAIVREIFTMYVNNMSIRAIARELHERGVKLWTCKTERKSTSYLTMCCNVNNILHREEYTGKKNRPQIISQKLYDEAQYIMKHKTICTTRKEVEALLRGMIYSKESGYLLSANATTKFYYSKRVKGPSISFECADNVIWDWVKEKYIVYKEMNEERMLAHLNKEYSIIETKLKQIFNRTLELNKSLDRLEERIVYGNISTPKANEISKKIHDELDELNRSNMQLQEQRIDIKWKIRDIQEMNYDINTVRSLKDKIHLVHQMISRIYIERTDRTHCYLHIESNITDNETLYVDTYHKMRIC